MGNLNQRGQIVGSQTLPGDATWDPFLWDGKQLIDLGSLGGDIGFGNWVNDAGEVVGQSALAGDQVFHAFLWKNGKMSDLGLLPGDTFSEPEVINASGQIVGYSGNPTGISAVLWENGQIFDLNTLVAGAGMTLSFASDINDRGEISAFAVLPDGDQHAVLLVPCGEGTDGCVDAVEGAAATPNIPTRSAGTPTTSIQRHLTPGMLAWRARLARRYRIPGQPMPRN